MEQLALLAMMKHMAPRWKFKNIRMWCDNRSVVFAVADKRAPLIRRDMNFLLIEMCKLSVEYKFRFWIEWIEGDFNVLADRLSRFKDLYIYDEKDPSQFQYFPRNEVVDTVNTMFLKMLDFKNVPRNDDDPLKYR